MRLLNANYSLLQDRRNADSLDCRIDLSQLRLHEKRISFIGKTFSPWINASKLVKTADLWAIAKLLRWRGEILLLMIDASKLVKTAILWAIAKLSLWKGKTLSPWINASKLVKMAGL